LNENERVQKKKGLLNSVIVSFTLQKVKVSEYGGVEDDDVRKSQVSESEMN